MGMKETTTYSKKDELRKNVIEMNKVFPKVYRLPLRAGNKFGNIEPTKCRVMSSKMAPLWLCFDTVRPVGQKYQVLFKCGDDLRQDQLVLQSLSLFDRIWQLDDMNLNMIPYGCIATGFEVGLIEVVPNATTIAAILANVHPSDEKLTVVDAIASSFGQSLETTFSVRKWLWEKEQENDDIGQRKRKGGGSNNNIQAKEEQEQAEKLALEAEILAGQTGAQNTQLHYDAYLAKYPISEIMETKFIMSCAGYCVATYVLGIGDRHPSNIMLKEDGRLFHIDFGHFLGNFKSKFGVKRETSPFVFTPQFAAVFGGANGQRYEEFCQVCCNAYNALRRESQLIISLFRLMISSGLPELQTEEDLYWLREKLSLAMTEDEASAHFRAMIKESLENDRTKINNFFHIMKHR